MPRRSPRPSTRRPRWKRRPDARPEEILEAALAVFGEQGYAGTRLDDVARRAGVSKGTLYLYFSSKEDLFRAMVEARVEGALAGIEELVRAWDGSTTDLLEAFVEQYWGYMGRMENCRLARLVISELANFPELARFHYRRVVLRVRRVIESILERGIAQGEFRRLDPVFAARALQLLCVHLAQFLVYFQPHDPTPVSREDMLAGILDLYLHGVLSTSAPAAPES
jgi:AcrR family transcriptional regulator